MFQIDTDDAVAVKPAKEAAGTPGFFASGNPGSGTPATKLTRDFANSIMCELVNVIEGAGVTLDKANDAQLKTAIELMIAGGATSSAKPRGHIAGLGLSNAGVRGITVEVGSTRGAGDSFDMVLNAPLTKQLDAAFAAGDTNGGLFSGVLAPSTTYHFFLIRKDSDGAIDAGFDIDIGAANIPVGFTARRRIGSVMTDGSSNIRPFLQWGDYFVWKTPVLDWDVAAPGVLRVLRTISVPLGLRVYAQLNAYLGNVIQGPWIYLSSPDVDDQAPSETAAPLVTIGMLEGSNDGESAYGNAQVLTNTAGQISTRVSHNTVFRGSVTGYIDLRGKDQ